MITDMQVFFNMDISKLSDEVVKSVFTAFREEVSRRRLESKVSKRARESFTAGSDKVFRGLPNLHHSFSHRWLKHLDMLLAQDWSHLFSGDEEKKYYVYMHADPSGGKGLRYVGEKAVIKTQGMPFYVGKGTGDRAYDLKRNQGHGAMLRQLLERHSPIDLVHIVKDGLTEVQALELESKLIYFFGTRYEKGRRGVLVNLEIPPRPKFI